MLYFFSNAIQHNALAVKKQSETIRTHDAAITEYTEMELSLRMLSELKADKSEVTSKTYFDGGNIMCCISGCFRYVFADGAPVTLRPGDCLVIYPGNTVSIESLKPGGRLRYMILIGSHVDAFFASFGFCDHLTFRATPQDALFLQASKHFDDGDTQGALSLLRDVLKTFATEMRYGGRQLLFDAIAVIQQNLLNGKVRLKPVLDDMHISRATLHRVFTRNGFEGPGEFMRREQFRRAAYLLTKTSMPIGEVARSVGCPSTVYFTTFIRRFTQMTPTEFRKAGVRVC